MEHLCTDFHSLCTRCFRSISVSLTCRIFHEIRKIQKLNDTLTKREENLEPASPSAEGRTEDTDGNYPEIRAGES